MSKKMIARMRFLKKEWDEPAKIFGAESVPKGFGECGGTLTADPVIEPYLVREGVEAVSIS